METRLDYYNGLESIHKNSTLIQMDSQHFWTHFFPNFNFSVENLNPIPYGEGGYGPHRLFAQNQKMGWAEGPVFLVP